LRDGFFRSGEIIECLNVAGNMPDESDKLIIFAIVGARTGRHCLRMEVGIGSRSHCLVGQFRMSLEISVVSVGRKWSRARGECFGSTQCGDWETGHMLARNLVTLSEKNVANCCAIDVTEELFGSEGTDDRCSRELMVFHSLRGLELFDEMRLEWYSLLVV